MEYLLLIIIGILLMLVSILTAKIYFLRRSTMKIAEAFREKLAADTNTLISISSRDVCIRRLACEINDSLKELRQKRHRYQQGDLELKEAITSISHDLRTPLTAISGYLDLLKEEEQSDNIRRYLAQIRNRTEALTALTEELFRYSIVMASSELKPGSMDMVQALEESLLSFYALMQEKNIQPKIKLPEAPLFCRLDADAVSRIFSNIISNAIKYSEGDFSVTMDEAGYITFANTATGLDAITVGRLFDRFFTVEASRNSTGLGLSIAKTLTERMGGHIKAVCQNDRLQISLYFPPETIL